MECEIDDWYAIALALVSQDQVTGLQTLSLSSSLFRSLLSRDKRNHEDRQHRRHREREGNRLGTGLGQVTVFGPCTLEALQERRP